jgi:hypothetical protein
VATYDLGAAVFSGEGGVSGKASRGGVRMLLDEELEAHDRREAKRKLTKPYTNEFVAAYVANDPHPTQLGAGGTPGTVRSAGTGSAPPSIRQWAWQSPAVAGRRAIREENEL